MEQQYSNREIDRMHSEILETLRRIESQTTKTNGRVTSLEQWRWIQAGGLVVISTLILPLIFKFL